ncbi:hypothetical protein MMC28_001551 [Mycoblastus sanguinarius]|nr:hypothetical protein [Mycoblastus sanguinarius]
MGGSSSNQLTQARALQIAKDSQSGQIPPPVTALLERNIGDLWRRIQAQPTTYIMSKDEYAVFNYYQGRYQNDRVGQQAVARFWNHYKGEGSQVDGARSSSTAPSTSGAR